MLSLKKALKDPLKTFTKNEAKIMNARHVWFFSKNMYSCFTLFQIYG